MHAHQDDKRLGRDCTLDKIMVDTAGRDRTHNKIMVDVAGREYTDNKLMGDSDVIIHTTR